MNTVRQLHFDLEQRLDENTRFAQETAEMDRTHGHELAAMSDEELRRLFNLAFQSLAAFEWGLYLRRGRLVGPQRAGLLRALDCGREAVP